MSCYSLNDHAHVSFGELVAVANLPEVGGDLVYDEIRTAAFAAGATSVWKNEPFFHREEFYDREKKNPSAYFGKPVREVRFFGELSTPGLKEAFLEIQAKYGMPDPKYRADVMRYCR